MEVAKLRGNLTQCWLAESLVQVLERAATYCQVERYNLVSFGDATVAEQGIVLSKLMKGFLRRDDCSCDDGYTHVNNVDDLKVWTSEAGGSGGMLFVVYAPCKDKIVVKEIVDTSLNLQSSLKKSLLLVLQNPAGLLGLKTDGRALESSVMYYLGLFGGDGSLEQTEVDRNRSLKFIAQPLNSLRDQCGCHFVMEIVRWVPKSTEDVLIGTEVLGAARATMFSTINQLPFQLLLLVLRWSHFHPELVRVCYKKLRRQIRLIPQARIRQELADLQRLEMQIWDGLYISAEPVEDILPMLNQEQVSSPLLLGSSKEVPPRFARLSECRLWDTQKEFYKDQGIRAWSSGAIPFGVSSSSFLAAAYARVVVDFLLSNADCVKPSFKKKDRPNCFVWEAASGSCKFLHSFMLHFTELVVADEEFNRRGLVPLVVATDLSEQVLNSRRQMKCFRSFLEHGQLDFALFDTHDFVHGNPSIPGKRKTLELMHSQRKWHVGSDGPVALMGNYFFDSLRADIFTVAIQHNQLPATNIITNSSYERVVMQTALLDITTSSISDIDVNLHPIVDPRTHSVFDDDRLNATLGEIVDQFQLLADISSPPAAELASRTGLIIFPVEAFEFFLTLIDQDDQDASFPVAILAGDARFSFKDSISNTFITTTNVESTSGEGPKKKVNLELPQLSPHPDCFCLPVDFDIFRAFFEHLNTTNTGISANSKFVSAPASDTFDVFFATVEHGGKKNMRNKTSNTIMKAPHTSFTHQFASFTPGDCDLLWGMMSFDNGATYFSADTLLALLAQTGWDFDLFSVLHWELLNRLRRDIVDSNSESYRNILIEAGIKSWRTFYHMEQQTETDVITRGIRLQLARWFYGLEAYGSVVEVLRPWCDEFQNDSREDDVGVFYLLGLTKLRMDEYWTALSFFRLCARLAPTKLKFQRQVARTLLALQTLRSASNSSNES